MSDLKFIETDAGKVYDTILGDLENGVREPLYPGDERRIFGESLAQVIVSVYTPGPSPWTWRPPPKKGAQNITTW